MVVIVLVSLIVNSLTQPLLWSFLFLPCRWSDDRLPFYNPLQAPVFSKSGIRKSKLLLYLLLSHIFMKNKAYYYYYNHNFINKHLAYEQFSLETSKPVNNIKCLPAVSTNRIQINLNGASHFLDRLILLLVNITKTFPKF